MCWVHQPTRSETHLLHWRPNSVGIALTFSVFTAALYPFLRIYSRMYVFPSAVGYVGQQVLRLLGRMPPEYCNEICPTVLRHSYTCTCKGSYCRDTKYRCKNCTRSTSPTMAPSRWHKHVAMVYGNVWSCYGTLSAQGHRGTVGSAAGVRGCTTAGVRWQPSSV